jgi:hypothetical protein
MVLVVRLGVLWRENRWYLKLLGRGKYEARAVVISVAIACGVSSIVNKYLFHSRYHHYNSAMAIRCNISISIFFRIAGQRGSALEGHLQG